MLNRTRNLFFFSFPLWFFFSSVVKWSVFFSHFIKESNDWKKGMKLRKKNIIKRFTAHKLHEWVETIEWNLIIYAFNLINTMCVYKAEMVKGVDHKVCHRNKQKKSHLANWSVHLIFILDGERNPNLCAFFMCYVQIVIPLIKNMSSQNNSILSLFCIRVVMEMVNCLSKNNTWTTLPKSVI